MIYVFGSILVAKEGYGLGRIAYSGKTLEGQDVKIIPTEPNALSYYFKGISL